MRNKTILAATLAAVMISGTAVAGPKYSYIEGGFARLDVDGAGHVNGGSITGSFAITDAFHVLGNYNKGSESGVDLEILSLMAGFNHSFSDNADFVARAGWYNTRLDTGPIFGSFSDDGWTAQIGIRGQLTPSFELSGFISTFDGDDTSVDLNGVYNFTNNVGVTATARIFDDFKVYVLGLRYTF